MTDPQQMRTYFSPKQIVRIQRYAEDHEISYAQATRDLVDKGLGEDAIAQGAPWLDAMLNAIFMRVFRDLPPTLERLVGASIEQRQWHQAAMLKLLEILGEKDPAAQDARVLALTQQIERYTLDQTYEFYRALQEPTSGDGNRTLENPEE